MLVTTKTLLKKAQREGYAVGAFNTFNLAITQSIVETGIKMNSPLIIAVTPNAIKFAGLKEISFMVRDYGKEADIPIALHLDHGKTIETVNRCLGGGFTSVMMDGSLLPLKKNIELARETATLSHSYNVPAEGELGKLAGLKGNDFLTDPSEAAHFVKESNIDSLAVAIGTSHGAYKFKGLPKLDIQRLKEIRENVNVPLVLHGASAVEPEMLRIIRKYGGNLEGAKGVSESEIRKAVKNGISKVNIDTDLRLAYTAGIRKKLATSKNVYDPREIIRPAKELMSKIVEKKIKLLGSKDKA
ncbi:MAG: class II fructose-bisphosphate aldolase [bacterium]|nr:class II fructose-bisphosphate aldolase [bacterium]